MASAGKAEMPLGRDWGDNLVPSGAPQQALDQNDCVRVIGGLTSQRGLLFTAASGPDRSIPLTAGPWIWGQRLRARRTCLSATRCSTRHTARLADECDAARERGETPLCRSGGAVQGNFTMSA